MNQTLIIQLIEDGQTLLKLEYSTELPRETILERIPLLLETPRVQMTKDVSGEVSPKYERLAQLLVRQQREELEVTFAQLEKELGRTLPDSARTQRAWWANTLTHSQATAWMLTGWKVSSVDLENEVVKFGRE